MMVCIWLLTSAIFPQKAVLSKESNQRVNKKEKKKVILFIEGHKSSHVREENNIIIFMQMLFIFKKYLHSFFYLL